MKNSLTQFSNQQLSPKSIGQLKGGNTFCEWYISYCEENGLKVKDKKMARFAKCDRVAARKGMNFALDKFETFLEKMNYLD